MNSIYRRAKSAYQSRISSLLQGPPFSAPVILHFSYHKCLTVYYNRVFSTLGREFGFPYIERFYVSSDTVRNELLSNSKKRILNLSMSEDVQFEGFPDYRGSYFIRDPRDLIVSGYKYHLWTEENWCNEPFQGWEWMVQHPIFLEHIEPDPDKHPQKESYKEYLQSLTPEKGILLEIVWRQSDFSQMQNWNLGNEKILHQRYENIIGNELSAFQTLFEHYQLRPDIMARGLELVEKYALKNQAKGETNHIRSGSSGQWSSEFTPLHKDIFKQFHGPLLVKLGYEESDRW